MAAVHVADIILPGVWLEKDPSWTDDTARDIEGWLRALPNELDRCAVALGLFEEVRHHSAPSSDEWERERSRERIQEEALLAAGVTLLFDGDAVAHRNRSPQGGLEDRNHARFLPASLAVHVRGVVRRPRGHGPEAAGEDL